MLSGRRVVLGVSGGVAAYKSAYLARRLLEAGAEVRVVMTPAAQRFIGAQTFASLTGSHPLTDLFEDPSVSPHTELARWAELVIVAPATAATIARLAHGIADNALAATLLATRAPVVLAPAMHTEMWEHPATRRNISLIEADGHRIIGPFSGELAGGDVGIGRVAEPEEIVEFAKTVLHRPLEGLTVLVTAGGTREALDPVRYLGNRSSGKMGHAIAAAAAQRGAHVELVTTSSLPAPPGANVHRVESAQEMLEAVEKIHPDIAVFAAAVADFRPAQAAQDKLSRSDGPPTLVLEPTPDILASVVARGDDIFVVGFAAETGGVERAIEKAKRKGVDLMVYNDVTAPGSGFGTDTNQVTLIEPDGTVDRWPQLSKAEVASRLMEIVANRLGR
ncbi:MAG: bifunctional phosphopantothenoylcysteine decarboxylase/phosphopantothenate--cysteine ligase CoaBC [Actinomycetes bacterium]|jgi:phosphopantothenoylcysteine decarboxylase/phosphopantothenate--cysteine ligase|nr:bifunctional phosphopantothenoylcysteine decarboxylase/phosphopantothenate--cysteine ligase CoaBC [Acidimicrobiia bacterium]